MHRIRVYVDTSVFGGTQDEEFSEESRSFFKRVQAEEFSVILSEQTLRELSRSPDSVQAVWQNLPPDLVGNIAIDNEVGDLAYAYNEDI
ncbi:MAG: hypothetical protein ACOZF0_07250 [Thermodesulfobacteriota bacterium]